MFWVFMGYFARGKPAKSAWFKLILFLPALIISLTSLGVERISSFTSAANEVLCDWYVVIVISLLLGFSLLLRDMFLGLRHSRNPRLKNSIRLMLYGTIATFAFAVLTNIFLPIFLTSWSVSRLGPIFTLFLVGTTSYAIIRHKLFDIRFFVVRAAAYLSSLFVMTFALVLPIVLIFGYFLGFHPTTGQLAVVVLLSVCVLYVLQYIRTTFDRLTTRIFFRHYYDFQDVLDKISNLLVRTADVETLRSGTASILMEALKTDLLRYELFADKSYENAKKLKELTAHMKNSVKIIDIDEQKDRINARLEVSNGNDLALIVKLRTTNAFLGYMVLSHKQSGELYSNRDKKLLSIAADEIAIGMQNALRFEEIQNFNLTLQARVDEATRKLRETNKRLKLLDETKDDFISMASHQLRTPLTSVKGYLSLVLEGDAGNISASQRKLLGQAFFSSQRMVYLIADLLNVSRLKTGKFVIESSPVNLADVIEEEIGQLRETAAGRSLELNFNKPEHFPTVNLDETKTRQVIMNFIDNAIYYTPAGGHITVSLRDTGKSIEMRVTDDGIGVPQAERHHLFSKFYRAKNAQKARPDGTGLGLFMARKVVVTQGGAIIFSSQEGKGSTFGFTFPKVKMQQVHAASTAAAVVTKSTT
jgi:signal transduction histidine kinase